MPTERRAARSKTAGTVRLHQPKDRQVTSFSEPGEARPAPMIDRVVARVVDLFIVGAVSAVALLPIPLLNGLIGDLGIGGGGSSRIELAEYSLFIMLAAIAALGYEPFSLAVKRTARGTPLSVGKVATDLELRCAMEPLRSVSLRRAFGRYLVSVGAFVVLIGVSFAAAIVMEIGLTSRRVVGLVAVSGALVWLSALLSALFRSDRRGWHDLLAGTVLVSTGVPLSERQERRVKGMAVSGVVVW